MESDRHSEKQMRLWPQASGSGRSEGSGPREEKDLRAWLRSLPPGSKLKVNLPEEKNPKSFRQTYIGFPAWLKPASGGGWLAVNKVRNPDELWYNLNQALHHDKPLHFGNPAEDEAIRHWLSRTLIYVLQQDIALDFFARCWYLGGEVIVAQFVPPDRVAGQRLGRYEKADHFGKEILDRVTKYVRVINEGLGYESNTVEFLIKDGVPYAIDFLNFACDLYKDSIGEEFAALCLDKVADYLIRCVNDPSARLQSKNDVWKKLITSQPLD